MKVITNFKLPQLLIAFSLIILLTGISNGQEVKASLTPNYLEIGQAGTFTLTFINTGQIQFNSFKFPSFQGFRIPLQNQRTERRITNNEVTIKISFQVIPMRPGNWEIPSFTFSLGQEKLVSNNIKFKIYPKGKSPAGKLPTNKIAFIKIIPAKSRVFIGESFPVKVNLYYDQRCLEKEWPALETEGFNLEYKQLGDSYQINIGNRRFGVTETTRIATALKTGELQLGPATSDVQVPVGNSQGFGLFSRRVTENFKAEGEPIKINSVELPSTGRPDNFNGLVGTEYVMTYSASPKTVKVGDPITVKIEIGGRGNISSIQLPRELSWSDFKTYEPKSDSMIANKVKMEGRKNFEMVVIPKTTEVTSLPDLNISYFDPDKIKYVTMSKPGPKILVSAGTYNANAESYQSTTSLEGEEKNNESGSSLAHIEYKQSDISIGTVLNPTGSWLWLLPGTSFIFMLITIVAQWTRKFINQKSNSSPRLANKNREKDIADLEELAMNNEIERFCSLLFRMLQQDISQITGIPFEAITSDIILNSDFFATMAKEQKLTLEELFTMCDRVRYGIQPETILLSKAFSDYKSVSSALQSLRRTQKK